MANKEIDFGLQHGDMRFRVNMYHMKGAIAATFRLITSQIRSLEDLALPDIMQSLLKSAKGLFS